MMGKHSNIQKQSLLMKIKKYIKKTCDDFSMHFSKKPRWSI